MLEFLIKIVEHLLQWLKSRRKPGENGENPPIPPELPFYVNEMLRTRPDATEDELRQIVVLQALEDTNFFIHQVMDDGHYLRNKSGNLILKQMAGEGIPKGAEVLVYRQAFPVNGGNVRETQWHITDQKGLIDITKFTRPE